MQRLLTTYLKKSKEPSIKESLCKKTNMNGTLQREFLRLENGRSMEYGRGRHWKKYSVIQNLTCVSNST